MMSSASSCLNSGASVPRTRAAAARKVARRSSFAPVPTVVITIRLPSSPKDTSLPGTTPAARRMCLGMVTWPFSVTRIAHPELESEAKTLLHFGGLSSGIDPSELDPISPVRA